MERETVGLAGFARSSGAATVGFLAGLLAVSLALPAPSATAEKKHPQNQLSKAFKGHLPITELSEDEAILHALNRLAYGLRPGDLERIRQMGLEKWIERQLHPESIDDSALAARLEGYPTLAMSPEQLLDEFPTPKMAARREGLTLEEYRKQREEMAEKRQQRREREMDSAEANAFKPADRPRAPAGRDPKSLMARLEESRGPQRMLFELSMAKLTRAVSSERQLNEVMTDFWFNHFNVYAGKGADRWLLSSYERDTIRPHTLGKFKDLLKATAKSPAMLFYLDNWLSADPNAAERMQGGHAKRRWPGSGLFGGFRRPTQGESPSAGQSPSQQGQGQGARQRRRGLNENYGRELMELHTLGVDGGYTQKDVTEVARCFTGWTLREPRRNPEFYFDERLHDNGAKIVLGKKFDAGGMKDGEEVLEMLARHPSTAKFISTKLARRFVADNPPPALVERMAKTFREKDGDIRAVLGTMIYSPEFWSREAYRAKVKTPFELVASAARALSADLDVPFELVRWTTRIGEPLYQCQPPTGYSDKSEAWVNTGALLNRLNFALALAENRLSGVRVDLPALIGSEAQTDAHAALARTIDLLLAGQASPQTRATLEAKLNDPEVLQAKLDDPARQVNVAIIAGLVLGSPEFQRR